MKVVSKEVKTFYDIMLNIEDLTEIVKSFRDSMNKHRTPKAFDWLKYDEIDLDNKLLDESHLKMFWNASNGDSLTYIANYYGFDGWQHSGYYCEHKKQHKMVVYNYGNDF